MVAALVRWQFDLDGNSGWSNAPAERVIGDAKLREGRNVAQLGGPIIPSQCSALQLVLNNHDGYYTFGAGMALGPGSKIRLRWRAATGTPWVTRFVGSLSELSTGTDANPIMITRWVGALYRFTSGNIPGRLIINQTPQSIMTVLSDAGGIPATDRDFDTDTEEYNRQLSPGYQGVQEVQTMVGGFIYDGPEKVRLELPATRAAKAVVARYTDGDPAANELGVPAPRRLTRPFGIINHVDGEYQYYTPADTATGTTSVVLPAQNYSTRRNEQANGIAHTLDFTPDPSATISGYTFVATLTFNVDGDFSLSASATFDETDTYPGQFSEMFVTDGGLDYRIFLNIREINIVGNSICIAFGYAASRLFGAGIPNQTIRSTLAATIEITQDASFEQTIAAFPRAAEDVGSIALYGYRPRSTPLVIGLYQATPLADDFVPDYAELDAAMQADLDAYATPIPVYAIERACDTADHRADILARRLSDKVHLTADGPSMLGADLDAFIEAIQTTIAPTGELTQTLWIEAA